jgi:hypothetical protein
MGAFIRHWPWSLGLAGLLMPLACVPAPALASTPLAPAPAVHEIDWRTSPLDLNLRGLNGERFRFHCPRGKPRPGQVVGSGPYTDASAICPAAVHAGVIRAASGGLVTVEVRPGLTPALRAKRGLRTLLERQLPCGSTGYGRAVARIRAPETAMSSPALRNRSADSYLPW